MSFMGVNAYPVNAKNFAYEHCRNPEIVEIPFETTAICGILHKGENRTSIALNKNRNKQMQNFDCMHELIHYFLHTGTDFNCLCNEDKKHSINQNQSHEWQANEGAAQALVPYQSFIPSYVILARQRGQLLHWDDVVINELSHEYDVTPVVIRYRIESLRYEIAQYMQGIPISKLKILSASEIKKKNLEETCKHAKDYCLTCQSIVSPGDKYCSICGTELMVNELFVTEWKGDGYVKYKKHNLDANGKALKCPVCDNEEINPNGEYCHICGTRIVNKCLGTFENDCFGNQMYVECDTIAEGNARHCVRCGGLTTFGKQNLFENWEDEKKKALSNPLLTTIPRTLPKPKALAK